MWYRCAFVDAAQLTVWYYTVDTCIELSIWCRYRTCTVVMSKSSLTHAGKHMDTVSFVHSYFISLVQGFPVLKTKLIIFEIPFHLVNYHLHQFINIHVSFHSVFLHGKNSVVLASWLKRDLKYIHLLYQQIHFQRLIGACFI